MAGLLLYRKQSYRPETFSKQFLTNARKDGARSPSCRARLISKESLTKRGSVEASRVSSRAEGPLWQVSYYIVSKVIDQRHLVSSFLLMHDGTRHGVRVVVTGLLVSSLLLRVEGSRLLE